YPNRRVSALDHAVEIVASDETLRSDKNDTTPKTINRMAAISSPHGGRLSNIVSQNSGLTVYRSAGLGGGGVCGTLVPRVPPLCDLVPAGFCCATVNPVHFLTTPNHNTNKKVGALPTIYPKVTLQTVSRGRAQCQSKSSRTPVDTQHTCGNFLSFLSDVERLPKVTFCEFGQVYQPTKPFS